MSKTNVNKQKLLVIKLLIMKGFQNILCNVEPRMSNSVVNHFSLYRMRRNKNSVLSYNITKVATNC